jgi:hypothetical protein
MKSEKGGGLHGCLQARVHRPSLLKRDLAPLFIHSMVVKYLSLNYLSIMNNTQLNDLVYPFLAFLYCWLL